MKKYIITILILVIVFTGLNLTGVIGDVKNFSYNLFASTQKIVWQEGAKKLNFVNSIFEAKDSQDRVEELIKKNKSLRAELIKLQNLKEENEELQNALDIELEKEYKLEFSQIISKNVGGDYILIDKGREDGILKDQPVVTSEKVLCGKIDEVYDNYSKVMLISNKKSVFSAKLEGKEIEASAKGQGEDRLKLNLIPKEIEIGKGDMVYTSQLGGLYPEGLLIGTIKNCNSYDLEPYKEAEVELDCKIGYLENLFILKDFEYKNN